MKAIGTAALTAVLASICLLGMNVPVAAAESEEFSEVGSKVTVAGGEAYFSAPGGQVHCEQSSGLGSVTSALKTTLEVKYEKCLAYYSTESKAEANVSTCDLLLNASDTFALDSGCKIEASLCDIEPAHFASTEEVQYVNGENKLMYASAEAEGIEFGVNAACELIGVKKGKGLVETSLELQNVKQTVPRVIRVVGASMTTEKTMVLKNTASTIVTFNLPTNTGSQRNIICDKFEAKDKTNQENASSRSIGGYGLEGCESNIFMAGTYRVLNNAGKMITTNCSIFLGAVASVSTAEPWAGEATIAGPGNPRCDFEGSVTEGTSTCKIRFTANQNSRGLWLRNVATPPVVSFKFNETNRRPYRLFYVSAGCPNSIASSSRAEVGGEGVLEIEGGTRVEIK
jgi:hypothetical protein